MFIRTVEFILFWHLQNFISVEMKGNINLLFQGMTPLSVFFFVVYIISSLTTIGMVFDNSPYAPVFELLRCMVLVTIIQRTNFIAVKDSSLIGSEIFFVISGLFWFLQCTKVIQIGKSTKLHWYMKAWSSWMLLFIF